MNRKDRRKQKQKNVGELPSGTQEEAYITENRAQAGQIITLCAMIAAYDLFDTPADAWEQMGDALQKVGAEYKAVALRHGIRAADQWLAQQTADSMGKYIRDQWPIPRAAKNDRERLAFDAQRDGINYSLRLFVLCARRFLIGHGMPARCSSFWKKPAGTINSFWTRRHWVTHTGTRCWIEKCAK